MKRSIARTAVTAAALLVGIAVSATPARAQEERIVAKVPFDFYVGGTELPAGKYTVKAATDDLSVVSIASEDGSAFAFVMTTPFTWVQSVDEPELVFERHENHYVLAKLIEADGNEREVAPPIHERTAEPAVAPDNP
jgi:hypothetical protein